MESLTEPTRAIRATRSPLPYASLKSNASSPLTVEDLEYITNMCTRSVEETEPDGAEDWSKDGEGSDMDEQGIMTYMATKDVAASEVNLCDVSFMNDISLNTEKIETIHEMHAYLKVDPDDTFSVSDWTLARTDPQGCRNIHTAGVAENFN